MKKLKNITALAAGGFLLATVASQANATILDITRPDLNTGDAFGLPGRIAPSGAHEDNETEPGTVHAQVWDLEAFLLNDVTKKLYIVSGYNLEDGIAYTGGSAPGDNPDNQITPGDLFIKVGGSQPGFNPIAPNSGNVFNSVYGNTYAVDLSLQNPAGPYVDLSFGPKASVYSLTGSTVLNSAIWDQFGSNPWKYSNDGSASLYAGAGTGASISRTVYTSDAALATALGLLGLADAGPLGSNKIIGSGYHDVLEIDLSWLTATPGQTIYFSYTMECGNDSLKGQISGGFDQVPDGGTSALLIGLGLMTVFLAERKSRRV